MASEDELNDFIMSEVIDSSSDDDDDDIFLWAAAMIIEDSVNHPGRIGSVDGHETVDRQRLLYHGLLYKDYFSEKLMFKAKHFRRRFVCYIYIYKFVSNYHGTQVYYC